MSKSQIKSECLKMGYEAHYLGHDRLWIVKRIKPSGNSRAFDNIVFANMVRELGIENSIKESTPWLPVKPLGFDINQLYQ